MTPFSPENTLNFTGNGFWLYKVRTSLVFSLENVSEVGITAIEIGPILENICFTSQVIKISLIYK